MPQVIQAVVSVVKVVFTTKALWGVIVRQVLIQMTLGGLSFRDSARSNWVARSRRGNSLGAMRGATIRSGPARRTEPDQPRQRRVRIGLCVRPTARFTPTAEARGVLGDCLSPYLNDGDVVWFDRTLEPRDGDLVLARIWYARETTVQSWQEREAVKQLRFVDGRPFLVCNEGRLPADEIEILGPVTAWYRPGWWKRPSVRTMRSPAAGSPELARSV
ncbi:MAG: S24 family peptidase [Gammaproteobacteria bacterium]